MNAKVMNKEKNRLKTNITLCLSFKEYAYSLYQSFNVDFSAPLQGKTHFLRET
jgi:hypothetical protein